MLIFVASALALHPHGSAPPCGTLELRAERLAGAGPAIDPPLRAEASGYDTEHFHIEGHGYAASDAELQQLGEIFEVVWAKEIDEMGYQQPYGTDTGKFTIYLENMSDWLYGYTDVERDGITPYIAINADMSWSGSTTQAAWEVTAAHEFFHAVQFSYDYWEASWWMEASSTWMEDEVYDDNNDYNWYLADDSWPDYPEVSMVAENGWHEYGEVIWARYLTTFHGGAAVEKALWEACADQEALAAMRDFFGTQEAFEAALVDFEVRNVLGYAGYEEGAAWYPVYAWDLVQSGSELPATGTPTEYFADYLGVNYWRIPLPEADAKTLVVDFTGNPMEDGTKVKWQVSVVGTDGSTWNTVTDTTKTDVSIELPGVGAEWHEAWVLVGILSENTGVNHDAYDSSPKYTETPPDYTFTATLVDPSEDTGDTADTGEGDTADTADTGKKPGKHPGVADTGDDPGCGCQAGTGALPGAAGLLVLAAVARRRRARA